MNRDLEASFIRSFAGGPEIRIEGLSSSGPASVTVLFGASGCGKTTVLRCLAGLERPQEGRIRFGEEVWFEAARGLCVPARRRRVGLVPQDYALFPHLSVARNIGYGLHDLPMAERAARVAQTLRWLGLGGLEQRHPDELSGGQRQRVALARAVVPRPQLLLLDEPLSALDGPTRLRLRSELRQLLKELGIPTIVVTHERSEALALGDRLTVMAGGRILQSGPVHEVFSKPASVAVAGIVAMETVQPGRVVECRDGLVTVQVGQQRLVSLSPALPLGSELYVCVRAEDVILVKGPPAHSSPRNCLCATIRALRPEGPIMKVELDAGFDLVAILTHPACEELGLRPEESVTALVKAPQVHLIPR